jgi:hypothetical protein
MAMLVGQEAVPYGCPERHRADWFARASEVTDRVERKLATSKHAG